MADPGASRRLLIAGALLLLAAVITILTQSRPDEYALPSQAYFYDLQTGQLFIAEASRTPPIKAPSGGLQNGVGAIVYGCGDCDQGDQQVAYLMKYTAEVKTLMQSPLPMDDPDGSAELQRSLAIEQGTLVALPTETGIKAQWHSLSSDEGVAITQRMQSLCSDSIAVVCHP